MYSVVIADDEKIECNALNLLITSEFPEIMVVSIAENGIELLHAVEEYRPDIAIVDVNMPGLDGLEAIELLRGKSCSTRFIVLTAYSEFHLVQKALNLKVDSYLLKPCRKDVAITTIRLLCARIGQDRSETEQTVRKDELLAKAQAVLEKEIIYSVMMGEPDTSDFEIFCRSHNCTSFRGCFITLLADTKLEPEIKPTIRENVTDILEGNIYLMNRTGAGLYLILFVPEHLENDMVLDWMKNVVSLLLGKIQKNLGLIFRAGISSICTGVEGLYRTYQESISALRIFPDQDIVFFEEISSVAGEEDITLGDRIPDRVKRTISNAYVLKAIQYIQNNYYRDISLEMIAEKVQISSFYLSRIFRQETGIKLTEYLTGIRMERAIILAKTTDLTISEIGQKVGYYNATYFCRLFKKCTGSTIGQMRNRKEKS